MKRLYLLTAVVLLLGAGSAAPGAPVDDFYGTRLREGRLAYLSGRQVEAIDMLRIAAFGLMDYPPLLSEALAFRALAQVKAERLPDADETLKRFLEVERRFAPWSQAAMPEKERKELEALLVKRIPPDALLGVATLERLVETEQQKIGKLPPGERARAYEARAKAEPKAPGWPLLLARLAVERKDAKEAIRWTTRALDIDEKNEEAREIRAKTLFSRGDYPAALDDLRKLPAGKVESDPSLAGDGFVCLVDAKRWDVAREAMKTLSGEQLKRPDVAAAAKRIPVAVSAPSAEAEPALPRAVNPAVAAVAVPKLVEPPPPTSEEMKKKLEKAVLSKDWKGAAALADAISPFADGEEAEMFYAAVSFYETGRGAEAKVLMAKAYPKISQSPFVEYYAKRVLR